MENIEEYREYLILEIDNLLEKNDYKSWTSIALMYAKLEYIKYRCNLKMILRLLIIEFKIRFREFIFDEYSRLSAYSIYNGPVLLNRSLDYIIYEILK